MWKKLKLIINKPVELNCKLQVDCSPPTKPSRLLAFTFASRLAKSSIASLSSGNTPIGCNTSAGV